MAEMHKSEALGELDPLIGRTVSGRYRVHSLLGQGGMGKVFQAQQIPLGRAVALKVLSAQYHGDEDPEFQKRFFYEAAILAKLKSPHTVTVFDYGRDGDVLFIAMELVAGEPLDRLIAMDGPLEPGRALGISQQICRSLREAHTQGVIHRDLKPSNVLVTRSDDGEEIVKVLDFGLAKRTSVSEDDTNPNLVPGSPKYMPPEAIRQGAVDERADIYSLGVMMYQMLTGAVPFDRANAMDILVAHLHEQPPAMHATNPKVRVAEPIEELVMRCLEKDPQERHPSMHELREAIRVVVNRLGLRASLGPEPTMPPPADPARSSARGQARDPARAQDDRAHRLRLEPSDFTPGHRRARKRGPGIALLLAVVAAAVGIAYLAAGGPEADTEAAERLAPDEAVPPQQEQDEPAPSATERAAEQAAETDTPDMVFSEAELDDEQEPNVEPARGATTGAEPSTQGATQTSEDELPAKVQVSVTSTPPGATVFMRGQMIGTTPLTLEHDPTRELMMRLELDGYERFFVRRDVAPDEEIAVQADLVASPGKAQSGTVIGAEPDAPRAPPAPSEPPAPEPSGPVDPEAEPEAEAEASSPEPGTRAAENPYTKPVEPQTLGENGLTDSPATDQPGLTITPSTR